MKKLIFIVLVVYNTSIYSQEITCSEFKTGTFKFENPNYSDWQITRNDTTQIETNAKTRLKIYSSIVWKNDCEFVLTCYKVLNGDPKHYVGKMFYVEITKTFDNGYYCILKNDAIDDMYLKLNKVE